MQVCNSMKCSMKEINIRYGFVQEMMKFMANQSNCHFEAPLPIKFHKKEAKPFAEDLLLFCCFPRSFQSRLTTVCNFF